MLPHISVCPISPAEIGTDRACYRDMSSFPETKAEKYVNKIKGKKFLQYNRLQLSRIYPKGQRLDSSNYDPLPMWICGSQLVALNFQTPGERGSCFYLVWYFGFVCFKIIHKAFFLCFLIQWAGPPKKGSPFFKFYSHCSLLICATETNNKPFVLVRIL